MVNPGVMNHDFADVRAIMSETGKVHLGTGISEGENRTMEATEMAISNPLLENNSMKGAKGVLINVTCSDDTSLHDIDLAINRVQQESDEEANIIWGVQKDDNLNGKFKISVISTGIDCENYFKNVNTLQSNKKIESINVIENSNIVQNLTNNDETIEQEEIKQTSFFVDLQQARQIKKSNSLEKRNEKDQKKLKKVNFFQNIWFE